MIRYGRQRYLHLNNVLNVLNIKVDQFYIWALCPEHALHIVKQLEDVFYEVEGVSILVTKHGTELQQRNWHHYTARNNLRRDLSSSEKVMVASDQSFKCNKCNTVLDDTFEVDHITEFCMGNNVNNPDRRSNLQALCVKCHKQKTKFDYNRFNPLFSTATAVAEIDSKKNNNIKDGVFSKYFYKS